MRPLQVFIGIFLIAIISFIIWQSYLRQCNGRNLLQHPTCDSYSSFGKGPHLLHNIKSTREEGMDTKCKEKTAVFFLKIHKCGSSTVQNILMRFGRHRHLSFVLPAVNNYVGNPEYFSPSFIGEKVRIPYGEKYDIFAHHTRYNHDQIKDIMKEGAPFVTIMRDPIELQLSMNYYYQLGYFSGDPLPFLLQHDLTTLRQWPRFWYRVGWNQIAWDLGVKINEMNMPQIFTTLLNRVEREFDLVMITEFMEASLVLFADLMCWPLEEVRFISVNAMYKEGNTTSKKTVLTAKERTVLEQLNDLDIQLYSHFKQRLKKCILEFGADRMISEVTRLINMNAKLYNNCIESVLKPRGSELPLTHYKLKSNASLICEEVTLQELNFTDIIRKEQEECIKVTSKLKNFLYN